MVWTSDPQTPQASMAMSMSRSSKGFILNCSGCQKPAPNWLTRTIAYLLLLEVGPFLLIIDHEALGGLWVGHLCGTGGELLDGSVLGMMVLGMMVLGMMVSGW